MPSPTPAPAAPPPAAPPTPAPAPAPAPAAPPPAPRASDRPLNYRPTKVTSDIDADLDGLGSDPTPPAPPAPPAAPPAPPEKKDDKAISQPTGETDVDHPIDPKPAPGEKWTSKRPDPNSFRTPKELRQAYRQNAQLLDQAEAEITKLKEMQQAPGTTAAQEAQLQQGIDAREKRLAEMESRLKALDYQSCDEYQTKYEKPFQKAQAEAYAEISQYFVNGSDGVERAGTKADFDELMRLPAGPAWKLAREKFGDLASEAMRHRGVVIGIIKASQDAVAEHQQTYKQREAEASAKQKQESERTSQLWKTTNSDMVAKYPERYGPDEKDPEGNKILQEQFQQWDDFLANRKVKTPEERIKFDARMRARYAAYPREAHRNKILTARVTELEAKLAEYANSEPGGERRTGATTPEAPAKNTLEDFDRRFK